MQRGTEPSETKEEFLERYPRPSERRALVRCFCLYESCTGWAWGFKDDLLWDQELAE